MRKEYKCTDCGGDATVGMISWIDLKTNNNYYKTGERRCLSCHRKHTGDNFKFTK